jgi:hypothetical protein
MEIYYMKCVDGKFFRGSLLFSAVAAFLVVAATADAAARPKPPSKFCVDAKCARDKSAGSGVKWNPGHYMLLDGIKWSPESQAAHFKQIDAIASEPNIRGVKLWLFWGDVEKSKGDYSAGFKIIDDYLKKLAASGDKHLILSIQDRKFGGYPPDRLFEFFPQYILDGSEYGLTKMKNGITSRTWQAPTMDRLIAMSKAMAARYDGHPNFEMYQTEETSVAVPLNTDGYTIGTYAVQLKRLIDASAPQWNRTIVRLSANFFGGDGQMADLISYCAARGVAIGGPDVIPDQTIQANRVFAGIAGGGTDYRGVVPWISEIQSPSLGGHEGTFTPKQLYEDGSKQMRANYFVWYRNTYQGGPEQKWDTGILPFIRSIKGAATTACPSKLGTCAGG